jgi:hypothetical protein
LTIKLSVVTEHRFSHISPLQTRREAGLHERNKEPTMDELNGRMMACQIMITGLIARVANNSPDPLRFLTDFRDEIKAVVRQVNIAGTDDTDRIRSVAQKTVDEMLSLMKPPSAS